MKTSKADITVHIDETLDTLKRQEIVKGLRDIPGIVEVLSNDHTPHLVVVEYDPAATSSQIILSQVACRGLHAELVGL